MSGLVALVRRELRSQLASPIAWTVGAGFLLLAGYFFFTLVSQFTVLLSDYQMYAQMTQNPGLLERINLNAVVVENLFGNLLVLFLFLVPALTMRSFADERRQGTDELLLTAPVGPGTIVAGKYLGLLAIVWGLVAASAIFPLILSRYGDPETGPVWTGLLGLALASAALTALGLGVAMLTESQVVAGVGSFVLFLLLFAVDWPARTVGGTLGTVLEAASLPGRFAGFGRGLIASPDVVYFLSLAALGLFAARAVLASRRWR